jgi:esterase/lipase
MFNKHNYAVLESLVSFIESEYDSIEWIKYISHTIKIIIAHSPNDEIIPYSDAQKLYNNISHHPNIKFIDIYGKHNDIGLTTNYVYSVSEMLQE